MSDRGGAYFLIPHVARALCERLGITVPALIKDLGVPQYKYNVANGRTPVTYDWAVRIARALSVPVHTVFTQYPPIESPYLVPDPSKSGRLTRFPPTKIGGRRKRRRVQVWNRRTPRKTG